MKKIFVFAIVIMIFIGLSNNLRKPEEVRVNEEMVTICTIDMEKDSTLVCD